MLTTILCLWASSVSCAAGALIWSWEDFCSGIHRVAWSDSNVIEGRTLIGEGTVRIMGIVLALALAPFFAAYGLWVATCLAAKSLAARLPCRHRVSVRCWRCGKTLYRVDGPDPRVVVDEQYPDLD